MPSHTLPFSHVYPNLLFWDKGHQSEGIRAHSKGFLELNHLCEGPVSKFSHMLRFWELGLDHLNVGGGGGGH